MKLPNSKYFIPVTLVFTLFLLTIFLFPQKKEPELPEHIFQIEELSEWLIKNNTRKNLADYTAGHFTWDTEKSHRGWTYYNGFMMDAFARLGKLDYVNTFYDANLLPNGQINNITNPNNSLTWSDIDSAAPARAIFALDHSKHAKTLLLFYNYLSKYPTEASLGNNYLHKLNSPNWQIHVFALDGLYMALPFLALIANHSAHSAESPFQRINSKEIYDNIFERMNWVSSHLRDEKTGLYYHGADEKGYPNGVVWLRGAGYYAMTQTDLIELLPEGKRKEKLKQDLLSFLDAMLLKQDSTTGMWRNVVNYSDELPENRFETSGSAMMSYALLKTYNDGIATDEKYLQAGIKAFKGIMGNKFHKSIWGYYNVKDIYRSSSVFTDPARYCIKGKYVTNEAKGLAPLIFAAIEAKKAASQKKIIQ